MMLSTNSSFRALVVIAALVLIYGCPCPKCPPPDLSYGDLEYRPVSPDSVLQEIVTGQWDSLGGVATRKFLISQSAFVIDEAIAAADPCPCCPDFMSGGFYTAYGDSSIPGCCRPCFAVQRTRTATEINTHDLDTLFEDILIDTIGFPHPGMIVCDLAVKVSRTAVSADSTNVTLRITLSDASADTALCSPSEKSWWVPSGDGSYWLHFREQFEVYKMNTKLSLSGKTSDAGGFDQVRSRGISTSIYLDLE